MRLNATPFIMVEVKDVGSNVTTLSNQVYTLILLIKTLLIVEQCGTNSMFVVGYIITVIRVHWQDVGICCF